MELERESLRGGRKVGRWEESGHSWGNFLEKGEVLAERGQMEEDQGGEGQMETECNVSAYGDAPRNHILNMLT